MSTTITIEKLKKVATDHASAKKFVADYNKLQEKTKEKVSGHGKLSFDELLQYLVDKYPTVAYQLYLQNACPVRSTSTVTKSVTRVPCKEAEGLGEEVQSKCTVKATKATTKKLSASSNTIPDLEAAMVLKDIAKPKGWSALNKAAKYAHVAVQSLVE